MNRDCSEGEGGTNQSTVPSYPSARPGIRGYRSSTQSSEEMARYGLRNLNNQNEQDVNGQGTDTVDNVMSKPARQTSPLSIRKKKIPRTNSYSQDEENSDDNNTNVLSKSLPAILPSHLPYSDDSEKEDVQIRPNYNTTPIDELSYNSLLNRSVERHERERQSQRKLSHASRVENPARSSNTTRNIMLTLVLGLTAVWVHWKYPNILTSYNNQDKSTQTVNHDKILFENNMKQLQEKYKIDDNAILQLKTGISTIFSRMDAGSFIFVYNSKTNNFNPVRFEKFADEVAYTAARYLRNEISSIQHTVVESSNLDMQEHGELITRYRDEVDRSGVMLVKEIDAVPSDLAMAFHYYCDEYDPLVKRSAIFFTLNMANCFNTSEPKSTHDFIEKCLARKWKTVPPENMRPLLTRVVDVVIDVTSVF